ncbi:hypothetical protein [Nonomuraea endophytica]|uniref:Site-specific recombinase n=1 Tax=Nonomuraea endophytica TaxID=714136 RepID=A0A7W8A304_9ACTN|nr:hypothetical protein [Nonomuraea endophytica]MBB5078646.1 site-specific recombinase [Nonomuraea endophytica]
MDEDLYQLQRMMTVVVSETCLHRRMPDDGAGPVLDALHLVGRLRAGLDRMEAELVLEARARRVTWRRIAEAFGVGGRAAAEQRARRLLLRTGG